MGRGREATDKFRKHPNIFREQSGVYSETGTVLHAYLFDGRFDDGRCDLSPRFQ